MIDTMWFVIYTNNVDIPPAPSRAGCETDRKVGLSVFMPHPLYLKLSYGVQQRTATPKWLEPTGTGFPSSGPLAVVQIGAFQR